MTDAKRQCVRCGKIKTVKAFFHKSAHCRACHKKPKNSQESFYLRRKIKEEKVVIKAQILASSVEVTYVCICAKNPETCKAEEHKV